MSSQNFGGGKFMIESIKTLHELILVEKKRKKIKTIQTLASIKSNEILSLSLIYLKM